MGYEHAAHPPAAELTLDMVGVAEGALESSLEICHDTSNIGRAQWQRESATSGSSRSRQRRYRPAKSC